ncbi:MAG: tyrosine-type recombinase/integrase [Eubacteriales bacterium]|nr:tyrosine-type recombinase/integrase [Eubacteriales bacterium]
MKNKTRKPLKLGDSKPDSTILIEQFIREKQAENVAPSTIKNYLNSWRYFNDFKPVNIENLSALDVKRWLNYLSRQDITITTVNSYLRYLKGILNWLSENGYINKIRIRTLKEQTPPLKFYTEAELERLLEEPADFTDFPSYRNWVIVNTLLGTGIRRTTLINLQITDVDFENNLLLCYTTKNKKSLALPLSNTLAEILYTYTSKLIKTGTTWLFPDMYGEQLKADRLSHIISKYNKAHGVDKTSVHGFRHTYARMMVLAGVDIFRLQRLLGHSSIEMTKKYVELFATDLQKDYNDYNPLEKMRRRHKKIM